jgi:hypothetical protein
VSLIAPVVMLVIAALDYAAAAIASWRGRVRPASRAAAG